MTLSLVYRLYAHYLRAKILPGLLPEHVGVILDGNRRFAESMGQPSVALGYQKGAQKVAELLEWCQELRIPQVTLWVLSTDNLKRPLNEVNPLYRVIEKEIVSLAHYQHQSVTPRQIRFFGQLETLPPALQSALSQAAEVTAGFDQHFLNVAIAYGGREEIVHAVRGVLEKYAGQGATLEEAARRISSQDIGSHLYLKDLPEPDLIIRTSGEVRLSGFMMWQSVYSEFYFCDAYWPAFRRIDFLRAIRNFQQRKRRYGR